MKKRLYQSPLATFVDVEQEGFICDSVRLNVRVKGLKNVNDPDNWELDDEGDPVAPEEFFFKS